MKTVTLIVMMLMLICSGCSEQIANRGGPAGQWATWVFGDNEACGVRVGYMATENNEVGILSNWYPNEDNDSQGYGIYAIHHIPGEYPIMNPLNPSEPVLAVCSYVGVQTTFDNNYDEQLSLFTGFEFWDIFFTELQFDAFDNKASVRDDEVRGVFGVRIPF